MKLFSLLPRRLSHFACNSPRESRNPGNRRPAPSVRGIAARGFYVLWKTFFHST